MLEEGRKEELKKQYVDSGKVPEDVFLYFVRNDPSRKQKYLQWMLKQYTLSPQRKTHIKDVVELFDQHISSGRVQGRDADIFQYDLDSLDQKVNILSSAKTKGETEREIAAAMRGEATLDPLESERIVETDRYLLVVPNSHKASCFFGANTKWCTSQKSGDYWRKYWQKGVKIYIIIDKKEDKKYAVAVAPSGNKEVYDENDKGMPYDQLKRKLGIRL